MPEQNTANNRKKYPVKIILIGVSKGVMHLINFLHGKGLVSAGDWLEVKRNNKTGEVTMTITIDFML